MNPVENQTLNSDFKMTALSGPENACESVLKSLKVSRLTYSVKETPFSAYVSFRKKFASRSHEDNFEVANSLNTYQIFDPLTQEIAQLKVKLVKIEQERDNLKYENMNILRQLEILNKNSEQKVLKTNLLAKENSVLQRKMTSIKLEK